MTLSAAQKLTSSAVLVGIALLVIILVAIHHKMPSTTSTSPPTDAEVLESFCSWHPSDVLCGVIPPPIDPCDEDPEADGCPCPDNPSATYPNCVVIPPTEAEWIEIPESDMNQIFIDGVDNDMPRPDTAWSAIQGEFSGAVCVDDTIYVHGGGHSGGPHNGVLSFDTTSLTWNRETEPSPVSSDECSNCATYADGNPKARHTYNLMATDGESIWISGGAIYSQGNAGEAPRNWKFHLADKTWSNWPESGNERATGTLMHVDGKMYQFFKNQWLYDIESQEWTRPGNATGTGANLMTVYHEPTETFYAFGSGTAQKLALEDFGTKWVDLGQVPVVLAANGPGAVLVGDLVLFWRGGATVTVYDIPNATWGEFTPMGDPGPIATRAGVWGRFSGCGGSVYLINSVRNNTFELSLPDEITYTPVTEFVSKEDAQDYVDANEQIPPGIYSSGIVIRDGQDVDLTGVRLLFPVQGKALVVARGETVLRNAVLTDKADCQACGGVRAEAESDLTIFNSIIRNQENGVLTGNDSVSLKIFNTDIENTDTFHRARCVDGSP